MKPPKLAATRRLAASIMARVNAELRKPSTDRRDVLKGRCFVSRRGRPYIRVQDFAGSGKRVPRCVQSELIANGWLPGSVVIDGTNIRCYEHAPNRQPARRHRARAREAAKVLKRIHHAMRDPSTCDADLLRAKAVRFRTRIYVHAASFVETNIRIPRHVQHALAQDGWIAESKLIGGRYVAVYHRPAP